MTLGKHEAHVLKLRYRNASNFEVSAKSRGEEDGSGACAMWCSRRHAGPAAAAARAMSDYRRLGPRLCRAGVACWLCYMVPRPSS